MEISVEKYHYKEGNQAKDIITKFSKLSKTPDPYTVKEVQYLIRMVKDIKWDMLVTLGGMYGLRIG